MRAERTPEEWDAAALALLAGAVKRGELPKPTRTPDGPAVPYGALCDWLGEAMPDYGPSYHCRWRSMLGAGPAWRWDIRPDAEAAEVRARAGGHRRGAVPGGPARREGADPPGIDPPATAAERERDAARMDGGVAVAGRGVAGARPGDRRGARADRGELAALERVLAEIREEDFCGEDPMRGERHRAAGGGAVRGGGVRGLVGPGPGDRAMDRRPPGHPAFAARKGGGDAADAAGLGSDRRGTT